MRPIAIINPTETANSIAQAIAQTMNFDISPLQPEQLPTIDEWVESEDAALVIIGLDPKSKIQPLLNLTRKLRIPYIFVKPGQTFPCRRIALPVTRFLEDREKAPYCASFARYFNAHVTIFKPRDYGSAAQQNIDSIKQLLKTRKITPEILPGRHDSSGIQLEASRSDCDLCIITASRDYGLDDIVFGPEERKIIKSADKPIMLINPRGDLYPLCD